MSKEIYEKMVKRRLIERRIFSLEKFKRFIESGAIDKAYEKYLNFHARRHTKLGRIL